MRRNASLRTPDQDTPENAAGQAGRSIDQWIAAALAEQAARAAPPSPHEPDADAGEETKARRPRNRRATDGADYEALLAAASAAERRAIETATKTAMALGSVASWIERAQERLTETTNAASKAQQETAAIVSGAVGAIGQRLEAIERKVDGASPSVVEDALRAIERIETRLSAGPELAAPSDAAPTYEGRAAFGASSAESWSDAADQASLEGNPAFEAALKGFEARIAELSERVATAPKPIARRALSRPDEIRGAVAEIRAHQAALAEPLAPEFGNGVGQARVAEAGSLQTTILTSLRADLSKLTGQLETIRPAVSTLPEMLREEIETLRRSLDGIATRSDLGRVEQSLRSLSLEIAEAKATGGSPDGAAREIEALQAEIRALEAARLPVEETRLERDIEILTHKLDIAAASGIDPVVTGLLAHQLTEIRDVMAGVATPDALSGLADQLSALKNEIAGIGQRQIAPEEFTSLKSAVEGMRSSLAASQGGEARDWSEAARLAVTSDGGAAVEGMLLSLMEKLDRVERKVPDPDALDQLEQQVQGLASRIGEMGDHHPSVSALEGSMGDLLREVATWRDGSAEAAEHAARVAVAATLESLPQPVEIERHLNALMAQYDAAEERTQGSLAGVHARLEDVVLRISSLESDLAGVRPEMPPVPALALHGEERIDEERLGGIPQAQIEAASRGHVGDASPRLAGPPVTEPIGSVLHEADRPLPPAPADEILLEPGSARPGAPAASGQDSADASDIKSSFIAAARRAAQAAASDAATARKPAAARLGPSAPSPIELLARLRTLFAERRRPLLLGAAAIAIALGAMQIARNFVSEPNPAVAARVESGTGPSASDATPPLVDQAAAPAPTGRSELTDPTTTQSIGPGRTGELGPQPVPAALEPTPVPELAATSSPSPAETSAPRATAVPPTLSGATATRGAVGSDAGALPAGLKSAAAAGNPVAMFELASRTAEGRGLPRDAKAAAELFEKAAQKGFAPAQYRMGNIYERGVGVIRDIETARSWYRRAAESGNVRAMHNLAVLIAEGGGGKSDYPAAIGWFQKAADHGVRDSQFNLAVLHARGLGVPLDLGKSYLWLAIAAGGGDEDAGKKRDEVAAKLSPADLQRAKAAVEKWRPLVANPAANEAQAPAAGWPDAPIKRASR